MIVRFRISSAFVNLFGSPQLCVVDMDSLPLIGDAFQHDHGSYRIVKVLEDIYPEPGSDQLGAIAFVMKIGLESEACRIPMNGTMAVSYQVNTAKDMRDCLERANAARKSDDREAYRRHVEEFLFLSHAVTRESGSQDYRKKSFNIPYVPVLSENVSVATAIRHGFIEACFASHVAPISSLTEVTYALDRMEALRPAVFIVTGPISLRFGLRALHVIRTHAKSKDCQIIALIRQVRNDDEVVAMAAGSDACALHPESPEQFLQLVACIQNLLKTTASESSWTRQGA